MTIRSPTTSFEASITVGTLPCQSRKIVLVAEAERLARAGADQQLQGAMVPARDLHADRAGVDGRELAAEEVERLGGREELRAVVADDPGRPLLDLREARVARRADVHPDVVAGGEVARADDGGLACRPLQELGAAVVGERLRDGRAEHGAERLLVAALNGDRDAAVRRGGRQLAHERVPDLALASRRAVPGERRSRRKERGRDGDEKDLRAHR